MIGPRWKSIVVEIQLDGVRAMQGKLKTLAGQFSDAAVSALKAESEIELEEAKARTPVDTGALKNSGKLVGPVKTGNGVSVDITFGGPSNTDARSGQPSFGKDVHYALFQHENHPTQSKFLESVILESARHMGPRVAERIRRERFG